MTVGARTATDGRGLLGPLAAEVSGAAGPTLVLLPPNPFDRRSWLFQVAHFRTSCRVVTIDLPGYGESPDAPAGVTMPDIAAACWAAVDAAIGEHASGIALAGVSIGSTIALHMATLRPADAEAIVLSGCGYRPVKTFAAERIRGYRAEGPAYRRRHAAEGLSAACRGSSMGQYLLDVLVGQGRADLGSIVTLFEALAQPDPDWVANGLRAPVLIISGTEDFAHEAAHDLRARIPGCAFMALDGAGHASHLEQPWAWDELAAEFLAEVGWLTTPPANPGGAPAGSHGGRR